MKIKQTRQNDTPKGKLSRGLKIVTENVNGQSYQRSSSSATYTSSAMEISMSDNLTGGQEKVNITLENPGPD